METGRVVIRKYENRRLYDTANSRYVNLDEIAQMVRDGADVQVVDAASGEDLTRLVLTQIIVEDVKTPDSGFPLDVLRQMVMASGRVSRETAGRYMKAMVDIYQNAYRDFMQSMIGGAPGEQATIQEMRRRIEELERQVAEQGKKRTRRKS